MMKPVELSPLSLIFVVGTRAALAFGVGCSSLNTFPRNAGARWLSA